MEHPGVLTFHCNICGSTCRSFLMALDRETASCKKYGPTVRMRAIIHALSIALFGKSLKLSEFPERPDIIGKGMSD
jgi:hypothetical protein